MTPRKRHLIIGDVHGCLDELRELLKVAAFSPQTDLLVFVGDLMDRGPKNVEVIRFVHELHRLGQAESLMGNHDEKYARFHRKLSEAGGDPARVRMNFGPAKQATYFGLTLAERDWLTQRPTCFRGDTFLVVHAGICPRRHRTWADLDDPKYKERLYRIRNVDGEGRMLNREDRLRPDDPAPAAGAHPWWRDYDGRFGQVYYGHAPAIEVVHGPHSTGLDTACCFGGRLSAAMIEAPSRVTIFSTPALAAYSPWDMGDE